MNIVIVSILLPYPLDSGGAQAQFNLIDKLRTKHHITFVFPENGQNTLTAMQKLQEVWPEVTFKPYRYALQLTDLHFFFSKIVRAFNLKFRANNERFKVERILKPYGYSLNTRFRNFIKEAISQAHADVVQVEFYPFLPLVDALPKDVLKVFVHHEIRYIRNDRMLPNFNLTASEIKLRDDVKREELAYLNKFDQIITLTDVDKKTLIEAKVSVPISVSPASVNATSLNYSPWNGSIIFLGGYAHIPNSEGVNWLVSEVFPLIDWTKYPQATFNIIGAGWPKNIKCPVKTLPVNVLGFVENLADVVSGSVMCVPILTGSGMRMKILEAAVMNVPFVTTSVGVEGLDFKDGDACLIADTPDSFAKALETLMTDREKCYSLTKRASDVFEEEYSVEAVAKCREKIWLNKLDKKE